MVIKVIKSSQKVVKKWSKSGQNDHSGHIKTHRLDSEKYYLLNFEAPYVYVSLRSKAPFFGRRSSVVGRRSSSVVVEAEI